MHLLSLFPSQGLTSLLASCLESRFIHPLGLLLVLTRGIKHLQNFNTSPCTNSQVLVLFTSASVRCHHTTSVGQQSTTAAFQDRCAKYWVCLLLFGIEFVLLAPLQEQAPWIAQFSPTSTNICYFSKFSRLPSPFTVSQSLSFEPGCLLDSPSPLSCCSLPSSVNH